jgi:hypothetical protein
MLMLANDMISDGVQAFVHERCAWAISIAIQLSCEGVIFT